MTTLSTHVLDAGLGAPAVGVEVALTGPDDRPVASGTTDGDGRLRFEVSLSPGTHRLLLATGAWFEAAGRDHLHPEVVLAVTVSDQPHLHVALLLGPWSYTTYRGS